MRIPIGVIQDKEASVMLSQIRVIDTKRLIYKIGFLDKEIFTGITKAIKDLF
jgi:mRNA-degrading endonuclease toxin of MazEF toxin-antitoxin module